MGVKDLSRLARKKEYKKQNLFYNKAYEDNCVPWSEGGKPSPILVKSIKRIKHKLKLKRALDLGCGEGRHAAALQRDGFKVIGIEYQDKALNKAAGRKLPRLLYVRGDVYRIPLKPQSFDLLVDYGVFHHIRRRDTTDYLKLLISLLVPGGCYLLSCFEKGFTHANGKVYKRGFVSHKNHYDRFSSKDEIFDIFKKDFEILEIIKDKENFLHMFARRFR